MAQTPWHVAYKNGLQAKERGDWNGAIEWFQQALQGKDRDTSKTRTSGVVFIEYYPHRELGICYFQLGDNEQARRELEISLSHSYSVLAKSYLDRIKRGERMTGGTTPSPFPSQPQPAPRPQPPSRGKVESPPPPSTLVGDRLSIAVLPFQSRGIGNMIAEIDLLDKLVTGFANIDRFKMIERSQLQKVIEEQKLTLTGIIDASTAAQIGKGIGVDGVICGSITTSGNDAASIDARLIDTETAAIITAKDAFSNNLSLQSLSQMISEVAAKFKTDLPILNGYVIEKQGEKLTIDLGNKNGLKKGMKCHVYREGAPIVHPVTNQVIGKMIDQICEVQVTDVFDAFSYVSITKAKSGTPSIRDKVITK
jgi:TolB-like protein